MAIFFFLNEDKKLLKNFFKFFSLLILIFLIDSLYQFFTGTNLIGMTQNINGRISSFFGDELIMGSFFSHLFLFYFTLFLWIKPKINKLTITIIVLSFLILIFLSASRTSMAIFFLSLFFLIIILKELKLFFIIVLISILSVFFMNKYDDQKIKRLVVHTKNQLFENTNFINLFSYRHTLHILTAYNIFLDHKIFGAGPKAFRMLCDNKRYIPHKFIHKKNQIKADEDGELQIFLISKDSKLKKDITDNFFESFGKTKYLNKIINIVPGQDTYEFLTIYQSGKKKMLKTITIRQNYILYPESKYFKKNEIIMKNLYPEYKNGCNTHPHNFLIQVASETGLVGLFLYIGLLIYFLMGILNYMSNNRLFKKIFKYDVDVKISILFCLLLITFFPILPSGNIFNNWISMLIYLPVGFLLNLIYTKKISKSKSNDISY
ncbi:O-antigen ligase family protein [Candidatus Pelagibacter sp.]|nr:O-antigen ligase family protein [Candidatus Pelagibacter sp.]